MAMPGLTKLEKQYFMSRQYTHIKEVSYKIDDEETLNSQTKPQNFGKQADRSPNT